VSRAPWQYCTFATAAGVCAIAWKDTGIGRFELPHASDAQVEHALLKRMSGAERGGPTVEVRDVILAATRYFDGERVDFSSAKLDLEDQSEVFKRIYAAARCVPWGRTTTYGALAKEMGAGPETARVVGQAMARNPIPLIIPCHRVLAAGGKLGGFSAAGGTATKLRMLELEGIRLESGPGQQAFQW
jgi:methylated-DNA-[protein]-cysteine S-methyltransferase